jgi:hypothetical protein
MNLLRAIVKAADPRAWISASTRSFEMRTGEGRAAPFDHKAAVAYYNSWIYAAAACAATPRTNRRRL